MWVVRHVWANTMKIETLLIGLPIIAAGPIVTVVLVGRLNGNMSVSGAVVVSVLIASGVAAVVSTAAHLVFKDTMPATFVSVFVSELTYVLFVLAYIFYMPEGRERAESFMWLPIVIPVLIVVSFPTALSVSYGTGMIVRDVGESKNKRSRTLARTLIDDDGGRGKRQDDP